MCAWDSDYAFISSCRMSSLDSGRGHEIGRRASNQKKRAKNYVRAQNVSVSDRDDICSHCLSRDSPLSGCAGATGSSPPHKSGTEGSCHHESPPHTLPPCSPLVCSPRLPSDPPPIALSRDLAYTTEALADDDPQRGTTHHVLDLFCT